MGSLRRLPEGPPAGKSRIDSPPGAGEPKPNDAHNLEPHQPKPR